MDPLSDVLALLKVQSVATARLEGAGAWALRFPAYEHMKFGMVIEGDRWLWTDRTESRIRLAPGDFFLLTDGVPYCFASAPDAPLRDSAEVLPASADEDGVMRFGEGTPRTVGVGGRFVFDDDASRPLLDSLPPLIHIRSGMPGIRALSLAWELIALETERQQPGAAAIASGLANIVLVGMLRAHLRSGQPPAGWLGALADERIGQALRLMHGQIARRWKVDDLAAAVAMSRTSFAERFRVKVGMPPLEYLTHWRMMLARRALRTGTEPLSSIARRIGYESDTAFGLAFTKRHGVSPGRYRTAMRARLNADGVPVRRQADRTALQ
ncbi:AraC family transcriptional regulator [Burkholderia cenocepacia]|nr:AraC family transcriptional regulator [Burkholderia cenocepacia]